MPSSFSEITDSLRGEPQRKAAKKSRQSIEQDIAALENKLHEMSGACESGSVRISAIRTLLERLESVKQAHDDARRFEAEERHAAITEAQRLLAEFAAAKFASLDQPGEMDPHGAAEPADAAGDAAGKAG